MRSSVSVAVRLMLSQLHWTMCGRGATLLLQAVVVVMLGLLLVPPARTSTFISASSSSSSSSTGGAAPFVNRTFVESAPSAKGWSVLAHALSPEVYVHHDLLPKQPDEFIDTDAYRIVMEYQLSRALNASLGRIQVLSTTTKTLPYNHVHFEIIPPPPNGTMWGDALPDTESVDDILARFVAAMATEASFNASYLSKYNWTAQLVPETALRLIVVERYMGFCKWTQTYRNGCVCPQRDLLNRTVNCSTDFGRDESEVATFVAIAGAIIAVCMFCCYRNGARARNFFNEARIRHLTRPREEVEINEDGLITVPAVHKKKCKKSTTHFVTTETGAVLQISGDRKSLWYSHAH